jgi:hypothetical protein
MDLDERWVSRSPQVMLETFRWFLGEGFGLIVEGLVGRLALTVIEVDTAVTEDALVRRVADAFGLR